MKIIYDEQDSGKFFGDIEIGEVFSASTGVAERIERICMKTTAYNYVNAVCLEDGTLVHFGNEDEVFLVEYELHVKDNNC